MQIRDLFQRDIFRSINGVVKADQLDESSIWQELDEFVVTKELDHHFRKFFETYLESIDHPNDPDIYGKIGVWVSGFFGSGKSHFIKVLSYLLQNGQHSHEGETKKAVDFFATKIQDAMLFADIKRAVASNTDVLLFNIDSKSDSKSRDAILQVFLKVFNEMQGFCPDHPHIAHMERYLEGKDKLEKFKEVFREKSNSEWDVERDAYQFHHDEVVEAWCSATGQSKEAGEKWIDGAEETFSLTVENFCQWVKDYLDSQGQNRRLIFLVDEVGQFIGGDTHLMLNLQTIIEELGTVCKGRAWVVVTSQEDIDAVLGDATSAKSHDFSKIQGRFKTRLSLSSANVDEVIQERLLAKKDEVKPELEDLFRKRGDILNSQLSFSKEGMTFRKFRDVEDFVINFPFAPYQFLLIQKVFEAIRKVGATGLHLSRGERSILDAFQSAAKQVAEMDANVLIPLYRFYPSIESFLDTAVKRTIDQAKDNESLEEIDNLILQTLFLIRYVEEIKGNVTNLVTLFLDEIDADRLVIKRRVEEGLQRLEKQTLISRSGDNYFFLTNEERDINREIKTIELSGHEEAGLLGQIVFDDVFKGATKHRFAETKKDFPINRLCDQFPHGRRTDGAVTVSVITPMVEDYASFTDAKCLNESQFDDGQVVIRLEDNDALGREIRAYLTTDKYLRTKDDGSLSISTKRIHRDLAEDNRERRNRLTSLLGTLLTEADFFVAGQKIESKGATPSAAMEQSLDYLIKNSFNKMSFIKRFADDANREIQAILRANDIGKQKLITESEEGNSDAVEEIRRFIHLASDANRTIVLMDMLDRFSQRPYGWVAEEVLIILSRLLVLQEIQLIMDSTVLPINKAFENITKSAKQRKIMVTIRQSTDPKKIQDARSLGRDVFSEMGPDGVDDLFEFFRQNLQTWERNLNQYQPLAERGDYPGGEEIKEGLTLIRALLACDESGKFIERLLERKDELLDLSEAYNDLHHFYEHQRNTWEKLRKAHTAYRLNQTQLERDENAGPALQRMQEILSGKNPYGLIKEADVLISRVETVNKDLIEEHRHDAREKILDVRNQILEEVKAVGGNDTLANACVSTLDKLNDRLDTQNSVAHLSQVKAEAEAELESAFKTIEDFAKKDEGEDAEKPKPKPKPRYSVSPAKLVRSPYLETPEDVEKFIEELKKELEAAIERGERIQIK